MTILNIFASFEFDKGQGLKNSFYQQAKRETNHRIGNCSLNESYPGETWKNKARKAISQCEFVVVLIGDDTHNASGVIVETDMARSLRKPVIQIRPQRRPYKGLTRIRKPIPWKWNRINAELDSIAKRKG